MKVKALIKELEKYPQNVIVEVTWEGIFRDIQKKNIYQHEDGAVLIDADVNMYKDKIMKGEWYYSNNVLRRMDRAHEIRR